MKVGETFEGTVTGIKPYGAFVELENNMVGLVHISEIKPGYVTNIYDSLTVGQHVTVQVIDIDEYNQKPSFSIRSLNNDRQTKHSSHRFSKNHLKIGFKPLGDRLNNWIKEGLKNLDTLED